jgi:ClpX C4-type zinc finger protein
MPSPARQARAQADRADWRKLHCAFCGKNAEQVRFLSAGVFGGTICDRCCLTAFLIFLKAYLKAPFRLGSS